MLLRFEKMKAGSVPVMRPVMLLLFLAGCLGRAAAQLPTCSGPSAGLIYSLGAGVLTQYDPSQPNSATNPSAMTMPGPSAGYALTVSNNLAGIGPSPTFYAEMWGNFWYYNGSSWTNTGHGVGYSGPLTSMAAGGSYIYTLNWNTGQVYRYNGTGPATPLITVTNFNGDNHCLAADCAGNWYILNSITGPAPGIEKYSPAGVLLTTYAIAGLPGGVTIEGMTLRGADFWAMAVDLSSSAYHHYKGTLSGNTVTFTQQQPVVYGIPGFTNHSYTACPNGFGGATTASIDTGHYCGGAGVPVSVNGTAPFSWTLVSGAAALSATTGSSITVTPAGNAAVRVAVTGAPGSCAASATSDTVTILRPAATVDAGPSQSAGGCGSFLDTLAGSLTGTTPGVTYNIAWTPAAAVVSGGNTLHPVVSPAGNTLFTLTVSTGTAQGGCTFTDTVSVSVYNTGATAAFTPLIRYGCPVDTVRFINNSTSQNGPLAYHWDFGDGDTSSLQSPVHVYANGGSYTVKLVARNGSCADSQAVTLTLMHPLSASFGMSADTLCQDDPVSFTNSSVATTGNGIDPRYRWDFGDGTTDTVMNPHHRYATGGIYIVKLTVLDFVPCTALAQDTIVVESLPAVRITASDTVICQGKGVSLRADGVVTGSTGLFWTFGDGTDGMQGRGGAGLFHSYDEPGVYEVVLTAASRFCPDAADTLPVTVRPYPAVNVGSDDSLCFGGEPIRLTARISGVSPVAARVVWNTGDTAASIVVRQSGRFWAVAAYEGCTTADSIEVYKDCYLDVPNVFTPNGDGMNDYFLPRQLLSKSIVSYSMRIYNRWGQQVWEARNLDGRGWDGKFNGTDQPAGVYIYLIEAGLANGYAEKYQGNVTLLR